MAALTSRLLAATAVLGVVQLVCGYSFNNCIEEANSDRQAFKCRRRRDKNISAFVGDLPPSTVNLTISINPVNYIPRGSFAHLINLQLLSIDHNQLTTIDKFAFQNLTRLQALNISFNKLTWLDSSLFTDLHNLTFLSLTNNSLKQLHEDLFSPLLSLERLIIRQNFLSNFSSIVVSVSHLQHLRVLDLCFNNLTSLTHPANVSLPESLKTLYLCQNNLLTLGCAHHFLSSVRVLDLSYNFRLPTAAFRSRVDLAHVNYLRLRSTNVSVVQFLKISNISPGHVDYSGLHLKSNAKIVALCQFLKTRVSSIKKLQLGNNEIQRLTNCMLCQCPNITGALDLSFNKLKSTEGCFNFIKNQTNIKSFRAEKNLLTSLLSCHSVALFPKMENLSFRYNRILKVNKCAFCHTPNLRTLELNINTIAYLDQKALKGLTRLQTLRLDNNLLTDLYTEMFEDLHSLNVLNLRNNQISVIFKNTFYKLGNLRTLDLGGNKITHFEASGLDGLKHLSKFYLDGNRLKHINNALNPVFQDTLEVLDLESNMISFSTPSQSLAPFVNLSKLRDLKLDRQQPHGLLSLPHGFFRGLNSLTSLYLTDNSIARLNSDAFDDLVGLDFLSLDNCCAGVTKLQPGLFKNLGNLTKLIVENMGIQNVSMEVFGNLTRLRTLQLNRNVMQSIDVDVLDSLPQLRYLDIRNIPLSCTCMNSLLKNWTEANQKVQVVYLHQMVCPQNESLKFHKFDTSVCYIDLGKYLFLGTALVIILFSVTPLLYVKLYWKMRYGYYVFRSWFGEQWRRLRDEEEDCKYDAFISYNSADEQWVMDELMPKLEGSGSSFRLCLHHRDFELGRDIVDNIVSAVYSSRKTICVVSRNFLRSEWCSLEIQLASYRLFDEHRDVLLLVFLEPISERQLSSYHRMRRVMLKKTYLQWPGSDCADPEQAQDLFWNQLRQAIKTGSRVDSDESYKAKINETVNFESQSAREKHYLQP